jgi:hypothetical protein
MLSGGNAAHPVGSDSPLQIVMTVRRSICLNQTFWVGCDSPLLTIMVHQKVITNLQRAVTPDQITQHKSSQRAGAS